MAITSEIIARLGQTSSEPIEGVHSGGQNSTAVIKTIEIPPGETWLIALIAKQSTYSSSMTLTPYIGLGSASVASTGDIGLIAVESGTVEITMRRRIGSGEDSFVGELYTMKL